MRGLSFIADGEFFTVDVTLVQKVAGNMTITPVLTAPDAVAGIANIKGRVVTVLNLAALLGRGADYEKREKRVHTVNAVIFKPFTEENDQMGLLIDKPGNLIDIDQDRIMPLSSKAGAGADPDLPEETCLSGMAESGGELYRIVSVDSIINRFRHGSEHHADPAILQ